MNLKSKLSLLFKRDWLVALFILGVYLATNRYIYGWDDQHLEIPLLKHLIDPMLYQGDYYVESLVKNFTSYLYPILARFITVEQIPSAYLFLFLVSPPAPSSKVPGALLSLLGAYQYQPARRQNRLLPK